MTDLPISGMLQATVDQASLRAAQQEIENELGDLSVSVDASGGGRGPNVQGREQAMLRALATEGNDIAAEQLEELELIYQKVDEIADSGDVLGGGGGDGILSTILDTGGDAAGEGAGAAALGTAATALTGSATALSGAAAALTGAAGANGIGRLIDSLTGGGNDTTSVEKPEWVPIEVRKPGKLQVEKPTLSVDDPSPLSVETDPLPVERDPLPVEDTGTKRSTDRRVTTDRSVEPAPGSDGGGGRRKEKMTPKKLLAESGKGAVIGAGVGAGVGSISPDPATTAGGAIAGGIAGGAEPSLSFLGGKALDAAGVKSDRRGGGGGGSRGSSGRSQNTNINVDVQDSTELNIDTREIRRELEREYDRRIRELERELDRIERDLTGR